ncbi:PEP-CTERM sorting domain-containing protein [Tuwongella immobilis]|uniref:: VPEP n=1 Tax=Tuwongella immobilis TaxID=692036 RepID=A0A6C2YVZ7_9BACT|nr:PEP-CTERM sorting domain-containing protein [Tuwongella immobilis]VIP05547.1 : VPEP [Tuwongella immobilis]VTS08450.1 : VPEP [Tuwongella immobilis]
MKLAHSTLLGVTLLGMMTLLANNANAGLIVTKTSVYAGVSGTGPFRWMYAVHNPRGGTVRTGDSFTIYDFGGFIPTHPVVAPTGWTYSVQNYGYTPTGGTPNDNGAVPNITFVYEGPDLPGSIGMGNFWMHSLYGVGTESQMVSSIGYTTSPEESLLLKSGGDFVTTESIMTPIAPEVPEPATLALVGIGLPLVGAARWIRRRRETSAEATV